MDFDPQPTPIGPSLLINDQSVFIELPQKITQILDKQPDENTKRSIKVLFTKLTMILAGKYIKTDSTPSEIIDNLFLGSIGAALNKESLIKANIKSIVICAGIKPAFPDEFLYKQFIIKDSIDQDVLGLFEESNEFIRENLKNGKNVLVHW